jgi:holo-[acyl-carrier protein] synthase
MMMIAGIGVDVVEIARITAAVERHGDRFLQRVFTAGELAYCGRIKHPMGCYAARFAVKEAVAKAFGTGIGADLGWLDIDIRRKANGAPFIVLGGAGAQYAAANGISEVLVSLSHSEHYAVAQAIALAPK